MSTCAEDSGSSRMLKSERNRRHSYEILCSEVPKTMYRVFRIWQRLIQFSYVLTSSDTQLLYTTDRH